MYYLSLKDIVLKSEFSGMIFEYDDTLSTPLFEFIPDHRVTKIKLSPSCKYSELSDYCIIKSWVDSENRVDILEGEYKLYNLVEINGFSLALSDKSIACPINQYIVDKAFINENSIELYKNTVRIKLLEDITLDEYISLINESFLFYVVSVENPEINTIIGIQTMNRVNKVSIRSKSKRVIRKNQILIESADYIAALILHLGKVYPEIQFYNNEQDINDTEFSEFIFYKANPETLDGEIHTSVLMSDPIYGDIIRSTCNIEFEYHSVDLPTFNKRKFDFMINRFISNITTCELPFPETDRKLKFSVHFDRQSNAGDNPINKDTQLMSETKHQYSFKFVGKLTVTIYRLSDEYPQIIKKIIQGPHYLEPRRNNLIKTEDGWK